jgi:hypothetical protein
MQNSTEQFNGELGKRYQTTSLIVIGQIVVTLLLIGIAWIIAPRIDLEITRQTTTGLWILIISTVIGVFLLRRILFSPAKLRNINSTKGVTGLLATLQMHTILLGILTEVIAIIGFLISVMTGDKFEMFRAGAIALVVFLTIFPRRKLWKTVVSSLNKPTN